MTLRLISSPCPQCGKSDGNNTSYSCWWREEMICKKCRYGWMYYLIEWVDNNHPVILVRKIIALLFNDKNRWKCARCGIDSKFNSYHVAMRDDRGMEYTGVGGICLSCWKESSLDEKIDIYHHRYFDEGWSKERDGFTWEELKENVTSDHLLSSLDEANENEN